MKLPARWPLHPAPLEGEALSSWLRRIADSYQLSESELLEQDLGHDQLPIQDLDPDPPNTLLEILAQRTGVSPDRLARMSLAGWSPWLQDRLKPDPSGFETYVHQFSILLKPGKRPVRTVPNWCAWIPQYPLQRACPKCLADPDRQGLLLAWQLPLLLSCPEHGCLLEPYIGFPGTYLEWTGGSAVPRPTNGAVSMMDRLTWQGLTTGQVRLPRRNVHAGVWFRLLRTLVDELSVPLWHWRPHGADLRLAWQTCGHLVRAGQSAWRPFETCTWLVQTQLLEAAASTIHLLETGRITGRGANADLFLLEPDVEIGDGRTAADHSESKTADRKPLGQAMEEAIQAAREDPIEAQALYNFVLIGCRDTESVARLRADFAALGIPLAPQSHIDDRIPFA